MCKGIHVFKVVNLCLFFDYEHLYMYNIESVK